MVFQLNSASSATCDLLVNFCKWFFALFANMPQIYSGCSPYIILPIFRLKLIHLYNYYIQMRSYEQMDLEELQSTQRRTVGSKSQRENRLEKKENKYGNMLILYNGRFLVTLGPDYCCFIPTFIFFCLIGGGYMWFILSYSQQFYLRLIGVIICTGTCLAYLAIATSNPGIVTQQDMTGQDKQVSQKNQSQPGQSFKHNKKLCRRCNIRVPKTTFHCSDCDVCIRDYDHHCPWTSKCIGGGNIIRFYLFVASVPIFFVYVFLSFAISMTQISINAANKINITPGSS